jgi:hypothetical protein
MKAFWTNEPAMRACKDMFLRLMAAVGFGGKENNSFHSFYSGIYKRLDRIGAMPDWVDEKQPLLNALATAACAAWDEHMEHVRGLHKEPLERMKQRVAFVKADNKAIKLFTKLDDVMADVIKRAEVIELYGMQQLHSPQAATKSVLSYGGRDSSRALKTKTKWEEAAPKAPKQPKSIGSANLAIGTYRSDAGLIFNGNILVTWSHDATWTMAEVLKSRIAMTGSKIAMATCPTCRARPAAPAAAATRRQRPVAAATAMATAAIASHRRLLRLPRLRHFRR